MPTLKIVVKEERVRGYIQIGIFDDRLEVWSCGSLPEPLTPDDLKKKHKSILNLSEPLLEEFTGDFQKKGIVSRPGKAKILIIF